MRLFIYFAALVMFLSLPTLPAQAQFGDLLNKAKKAVTDKVDSEIKEEVDKTIKDIKGASQNENSQEPEPEQQKTNPLPKEEPQPSTISDKVPAKVSVSSTRDPEHYPIQYRSEKSDGISWIEIYETQVRVALPTTEGIPFTDSKRTVKGTLIVGGQSFDLFARYRATCLNDRPCKFQLHFGSRDEKYKDTVQTVIRALEEAQTVKLDVYHPETNEIVLTFSRDTKNMKVSDPAVQAAEYALVQAAQAKTSQKAEAAHAAQDPLYNLCNDDSLIRTYYDCACMIETAEKSHKGKALQNNKNDHTQEIAYWEKRIASLEGIKPVSESHAKQLENKMLYSQNGLKKALAKQAPAASNPQEVRAAIMKDGLCKNAEGVRQLNVQKCSAAGSGEKYCGCVGDQAADIWLKESKMLNSGVIVNISTMAHNKCR